MRMFEAGWLWGCVDGRIKRLRCGGDGCIVLSLCLCQQVEVLIRTLNMQQCWLSQCAEAAKARGRGAHYSQIRPKPALTLIQCCPTCFMTQRWKESQCNLTELHCWRIERRYGTQCYTWIGIINYWNRSPCVQFIECNPYQNNNI